MYKIDLSLCEDIVVPEFPEYHSISRPPYEHKKKVIPIYEYENLRVGDTVYYSDEFGIGIDWVPKTIKYFVEDPSGVGVAYDPVGWDYAKILSTEEQLNEMGYYREDQS